MALTIVNSWSIVRSLWLFITSLFAGASARRSIDSEMAGQLITVSKQGSPASSVQLQGTVTEGWVLTARTWAMGLPGWLSLSHSSSRGKAGSRAYSSSLRRGAIPRGSMLAVLGSSHFHHPLLPTICSPERILSPCFPRRSCVPKSHP